MSRKLTTQKKLAVLQVIEENKIRLFGVLSSKETKENAWSEVMEVAREKGLMEGSKPWQHVRDSLWGVWKNRALHRKSSARHSRYKTDPVDEKVLEILENGTTKFNHFVLANSHATVPIESHETSPAESPALSNDPTTSIEIKEETEQYFPSEEATSLAEESQCEVDVKQEPLSDETDSADSLSEMDLIPPFPNPLSQTQTPRLILSNPSLLAQHPRSSLPKPATYFILKPSTSFGPRPSVPLVSRQTSVPLVSSPFRQRTSAPSRPTLAPKPESAPKRKPSESSEIDTIDELFKLRAEKLQLELELQKQLSYRTLLDCVQKEISLGLPPSKLTQAIRKRMKRGSKTEKESKTETE